MGLRSDIASIVNSSLDSLGDIAITFTFTRVTSGAYNYDTGASSQISTTFSVRGVLARFRSREVSDMNLLMTGRKAIIPSLQFPIGIEPDAKNDTIVAEGFTWKIAQVLLDPAGAAYILFLTRVDDAG